MALMGNPEPKPPSRARNLSYATIAGSAGCMILIGVIGALLIGMWIDAQLGWRGPCTVGLVVLSAPISLYIVVRIVLGLVAQIQPPPKKNQLTDTDSSNGGGHL
jgi:MFS family permease